MNPVFIIGWDGATFDLIHPWVARGELPNVARLLEEGVHGPLRSTIPPWTFPAWTSFMTGKNPGKHGIFDFFRFRTGSYDLEFVHGGHRRAATFWRLLSEAGRKVISISLPCTFPPEPVNGVMISGFDFPGEGPGSYVDSRGMYPPELHDELKRNVGRHPIDSSVIKEVNQGRFDLVLERTLETIRRKAATAKYLMSNRPWDCFMILFGESDGTGHQFWKYCDPNSPLYVDHPAGLEDSILRVYRELDSQVGELLERLPPDATILMMSDHGFGGVSDWVLYPNSWLESKGFLRLHGRRSHRSSSLLEAVKLWAVGALPAWVQRGLYRFAAPLVGRFEARVRYGMIDWKDTEAYFDENPYSPSVRINLKGRQPKGIVEPERYEKVRTRLVRELESWRHPETNDPIVERAYRREEIYSGPYVDEAPDVVPKWALHQGYSYGFRKSSKSPRGSWIEQVDAQEPENHQFFTSKSGTHRDDGILIAHGPIIRSGMTIEDARIIDLAPTILASLGVPIPDDMDGRVLEEIFTERLEPLASLPSAGNVPVQDSDASSGGSSPVYTSADEEKVAQRLRSLGYLE